MPASTPPIAAKPRLTLAEPAFRRDTRRALREAKKGPVLIIGRSGRPTHVLLSQAEHQRLTRRLPSILELLAQGDGGDFDFEPPKLKGPLCRPAEFD